MSRKCSACGNIYTATTANSCPMCGCRDWRGTDDKVTLHLTRWELDGIEWALRTMLHSPVARPNPDDCLRIEALLRKVEAVR